MKTKLMWIPFIPLFAAGVLLRVYQALFDPKGADTGLMSGGAITLGFASVVVIAFVVFLVMSILDKRTSAFYQIKRNIPAGVFALVAGVLLLIGVLTSFLQSIDIGVIIDDLMSVICAAAIMIMGFSSLSGVNRAKSMPIFMVVPAVWGFVRTFITFLKDAAVAAESKDMTYLFVMIFITLFLFNCSMVYINISVRNAVKGCFLYGLPAIITSFAYTLSHTIYGIKIGSFNFFKNVEMYEFLVVAIFAVFFLIELTRGVGEKSVEECAGATSDSVNNEETDGTTLTESTVEDNDVDSDSNVDLDKIDRIVSEVSDDN